MKIIILFLENEILQLVITAPELENIEIGSLVSSFIPKSTKVIKTKIQLPSDLSDEAKQKIAKKMEINFGNDMIKSMSFPNVRNKIDNVKVYKELIHDLKKIDSPNIIVTDLETGESNVSGVVITIKK